MLLLLLIDFRGHFLVNSTSKVKLILLLITISAKKSLASIFGLINRRMLKSELQRKKGQQQQIMISDQKKSFEKKASRQSTSLQKKKNHSN